MNKTTSGKMRPSVWLLILLLLAPLSLWGNDPNLVPDYIDYQKYHKIYAAKKSISDAKRANANGLLQQAETIDSTLASQENSLSRNLQTIANSLHSITFMTQEIPSLQEQNDDHAATISSNESTWQRNANQIYGLQQDRDQVERQIQNAQSEHRTLVAARQQLTNKLDRIKTNIRQLNAGILENETALEKAQTRQQTINNEITQLTQKKQQLEAELPEKQTALENATTNNQRLQEKMATLQNQLQTLSDRLSNLKSKRESAKTDLQANRSNLQALRGQMQTITRTLTDLENRKEILTAKIASLSQDINALSDSQATYTARLANLKASRPAIRQTIENKKAALPALSSQVGTAESQITQMQGDKKSKQTEIQNLKASDDPDKQAKIAALQQEIQTLTGQIQSTRQTMRTAKEQIQTLRTEIQRLKSELQDINGKIAQAEQDLQNIPAAIATKKAARRDKKSTLQQVQGEIGTQQAAQTTLAPQVSAAKDAVEAANSHLQDIKSRLQHVQQNHDDVQNNLSSAATKLTANQNRIENLQQRIAHITAQIPQLTQKIQNLGAQIPQITRTIADLQSTLQQQNNQLSQLKKRKQRVMNQLADNRAEIQQKQGVIDRFQGQKYRLEEQIQGLENHNQRLQIENADLRQTIYDNENTISYYQQEIIRLNQLIQDLRRENRSLRAQIAQLQIDQTVAWQNFNIANQDATAAEIITQAKLEEYQAIKANYDREYLAAQNRGDTQGMGIGAQMAISPATQDGTLAGQEEGNNIGRTEGLLFGYKKGLEDGANDGEAQGYKHGLDAPQNYQAGYAVGWQQGKENAYTSAHTTNYPLGRQDQKATLLKQLPANSETIPDNASSQGPDAQPEDFKESDSIFAGDYEAPDDHYDGTNEGIMLEISNKIERLGQNIADLPDESSFSPTTITIKFDIDQSQAQCTADYIDFINACYASFVQAYQRAYRQSYLTTYQNTKETAFQSAKAETFANFKTVRWQEGYDEAYPIAYQKWDDIGANEAQNVGYQTGKEKGYQENIDEAREKEYALGQTDESRYFQENAVLRLLDVSVSKVVETTEDGKYIAGDELYIHVNVANYGEKRSVKGQATVKLMAVTPNVTVDGNEHDLHEISPSSIAAIQKVARAKIKITSVLPQDITIRVVAQMPDGMVNTQDITIRTKMHMVTDLKLSYSEDEIGNLEETNHIWIYATNTTPVDAQENFTVIATFPDKYAPAFRHKKLSANLGKIKSGKKASAHLYFSVYRESYVRGKTIPFTFTVYYKNVISSQQILPIKFEKKCEPGDMSWGCM